MSTPIVVNVCHVCLRRMATYAGSIPRRWRVVKGRLFCRTCLTKSPPKGEART